MKEILKKLSKIQTELKSPKNQRNKFGNYNYRSLEDIEENLKPLLALYGCAIVFRDEIINFEKNYQIKTENINIKQEISKYEEQSNHITYIKSTIILYDVESGENIDTYAYAREPITKKGMDDAQITGATSSYARKYAANALFAIDDSRDPDMTNEHEKNDTNSSKKWVKIPPKSSLIEEKGDTEFEKNIENRNFLFEIAEDQIKSCKTLEQLKSVWDSILADKEKYIKLNVMSNLIELKDKTKQELSK